MLFSAIRSFGFMACGCEEGAAFFPERIADFGCRLWHRVAGPYPRTLAENRLIWLHRFDPDPSGVQNKHPRYCRAGLMLIRRKGDLSFRADPETHRVLPPGHGPRSYEERSDRRNEGQRRTRRWPGALAPLHRWYALRGPQG